MTDQFELPAELTIYNAASTHAELLGWVARQGAGGADVKLSARAVDSIDGAGLQLLLSLGRTTDGWRLIDASSVFTDACRLMGLSEWLGAAGVDSGSIGEKS